MAAKCQVCSASITWARKDHKDGWIPLDSDPASDGRYFINENDDPPTAQYIPPGHPDRRKRLQQNQLHNDHRRNCR